MSETDLPTEITDGAASELEVAIAAMRRDYSKLAPRIRLLKHSVASSCKSINLHLHFPSLRQSTATVCELVEVISFHLVPFCLPRSEIAAVDELYGQVDVDEFKLKHTQLSERAKKLFIQTQTTTNRNGEPGELLLYLLTEWILEAPQLVAKMSLKTNRNMPVHGADGIHIRFCQETSRLFLFWGESKLYADVGKAINAAIKSVCEALRPEKIDHEIQLVQRNLGTSGLDEASKNAVLCYLNPYEEFYNERHDAITCLIGFDFDAFEKVSREDSDQAEKKFVALAEDKLNEITPDLTKKVMDAGLEGKPIEVFFFPVPSVQQFRDLFHQKIGWAQ